MTKVEKAVDLYGKNFNCSQAVLTAFAEDFGLSEKLTLSLGTSFGGGARNGQMCGAVSGALMVLGLKFGHFESENQEQKSKNYGISVDFTNRVKEKCGSIVCKEMLNADLTTEEGKAKIAEKNLFKTLCPKIIADVVEILEKVIAENSGEYGKTMTDKEKQQKILNICKESTDKNPIVIFNRIVKNKDISIPIHGPIHHVVDGVAFMTAFFNAGGKINLEESFWELCTRAEKMPGGMCGHWGVCGAVTSVAASLSIIEKTGPLSDFDWGNHILYSSKALEKLGKVGGPRCCKRNAYLALEAAIDFVNENINHFGAVLEKYKIKCSFSSKNQQCKKEGCPFF